MPDTSETRQAAGKADGRQSGLECIILPFFVGTQLAERSWLAAQAVSGYAAYNVRAERTVRLASSLAISQQPLLKSFFSRWLIYVVP